MHSESQRIDGFSESGSRLTVNNLRKKNSAEDNLARPAGMSNEGEPSGNLESIAESSWDEESEADPMPYPPSSHPKNRSFSFHPWI